MLWQHTGATGLSEDLGEGVLFFGSDSVGAGKVGVWGEAGERGDLLC
jgi:hypothetical protein